MQCLGLRRNTEAGGVLSGSCLHYPGSVPLSGGSASNTRPSRRSCLVFGICNLAAGLMQSDLVVRPCVLGLSPVSRVLPCRSHTLETYF